MSILIVDESQSSQNKLYEHLNNSDDIFILMHWASCGPCQLVLPKWNEMTDNLEMQDLLTNNNHVVIATIESSHLNKINHPEFQNVRLFPTIKHIRGENVQILTVDPNNDDVNTYIHWIKNNILTTTTTTTGGTTHSLVDQMIQFNPNIKKRRKSRSHSRSNRNKTNKKSHRHKNRKSSKNKK
jgi:hypothetical protein